MKICNLVENGMMVDVWRVWGNWAVCSSELAVESPEEVEENVLRVVSQSSIFTLNDP